MELNAGFSIECCNVETFARVSELVNAYFAIPENRTPKYFEEWVKGIYKIEKNLEVKNFTDVHSDPLEYEDLLIGLIEYVAAGVSDDLIVGDYTLYNGFSGSENHEFVSVYGDIHWVSNRKQRLSIEYEDRKQAPSLLLQGQNVVFSQLNRAMELRYSVIVKRSGGFVKNFASAKTNIVVYPGGRETPDTIKAHELNQKKEKVKILTCEEFDLLLNQ